MRAGEAKLQGRARCRVHCSSCELRGHRAKPLRILNNMFDINDINYDINIDTVGEAGLKLYDLEKRVLRRCCAAPHDFCDLQQT